MENLKLADSIGDSLINIKSLVWACEQVLKTPVNSTDELNKLIAFLELIIKEAEKSIGVAIKLDEEISNFKLEVCHG